MKYLPNWMECKRCKKKLILKGEDDLKRLERIVKNYPEIKILEGIILHLEFCVDCQDEIDVRFPKIELSQIQKVHIQ